MSKNNSKTNTPSRSGSKESSHSGPSGNWPSTTPNPSGGSRGNAVPKK